MASVVRSEHHAPRIDRGRFSHADPADMGGLSVFRLHVDTHHARSLSKLIEREIIPRLMVAHATTIPTIPTIGRAGPRIDGDYRIGEAEVAAFVPLVMQVEADALLEHVEAIIARGVAFDTVMVDLLAPAARLLGEYWEDDRCDFVDVTMGLWRLQEVIHEVAGRLPSERRPGIDSRCALFASLAGDQHNFGTVVIDELFQHAGWRTDRISEGEPADLLQRSAEKWFDLIGLTISRECHIADLPSVIAALRNVSRNPRVCVMVGGRIFSADPNLAAHVGADGTARDAKLALEIADDLVCAREREAAAL